MGGLVECPRSLIAVAAFPVQHEIARCLRVEGRRPRFERGPWLDHAGQRFVLDLDQLGRVVRLRGGVGHHHCHCLTGVADGKSRHQGVWRTHHCPPVSSVGARGWGQRPESIARHVGPGQHCEHPRCGPGRRGIDVEDPCVGVGRAYEPAMRYAGEVDVVDESALAGEQRPVFYPPDRAPNHRLKNVLPTVFGMSRPSPLSSPIRDEITTEVAQNR